MANSKIPNVDLTDTFNTSRVRFNNLLDSVGDVSTLTTAATDVTSAINEHDAELGTITSGAMGTTAGTVSGAIAELDDRLDSINNTQIQSAKLLMNDSSAVSAIKGKLDVHGDLYAGGILYTDQIKSATASEQVFINDTLELQANDINDVNNIHLRTALIHDGDTNTKLEFGTDTIDLHTGGTARVAITNNDVTISENLTVQDSAYVTGNLAVGGNTTIGGTLTVDGEVTFKAGANSNINLGDGDGDNVVFNADVNSSIIPNTDNTYDLGSSTKEWRHGYFDGTVNADNLAADAATLGTVKVTDLTAGRIVTVGTNGEVQDDADLTYSPTTDTLSVSNIDIGTQADLASAKVEDLTNNRIVIAGTGGELEDDANLTFDGTTFEVGTKFDVSVTTGNTNIDGDLDVDGTTNLDATNVDGDLDVTGSFTTITTDGLTEGDNLYYTTARADSDAKNAVSATDAGGDGSFTYNNATGVFTYTGPSATEVRDHITAGEGIDIVDGEISGENATTSNKGIASFSSDNFSVSNGAVSIKNNGVILGTETTGSYVATIAGTANEIEVSGSGPETASVTVGLPNDVTVGNNLTVTNDFTVGGSFTVAGEQRIAAQYIFLQDGTTGTPSLNSGVTVDRGSEDSAVFQWNETGDYWEAGTKNSLNRLALQSDSATFSNLEISGTLQVDTITSQTGAEQVYINDTLELQANDINDVANIHLRDKLYHDGDTNTYLGFGTDTITLRTGGTDRVEITNNEFILSENLKVNDSAYVTGNLQVGGNTVLQGNLEVQGTTTTVNTETIELADNFILLNSNATGTPAAATDVGIEINRGSSTNATLAWDEGGDYWTVGEGNNNTKSRVVTTGFLNTTDAITYNSSTGQLGHADTSAVNATVEDNNSGQTFIQSASFSFDSYGHVTGASLTSGSATDTNTTYSAGKDLDLNGTTFDIESTLNHVNAITTAANVDFTLTTGGDGDIFLNPNGNNVYMRGGGSTEQELRFDLIGSFQSIQASDTLYITAQADMYLLPYSDTVYMQGGGNTSKQLLFQLDVGEQTITSVPHSDLKLSTSGTGNVWLEPNADGLSNLDRSVFMRCKGDSTQQLEFALNNNLQSIRAAQGLFLVSETSDVYLDPHGGDVFMRAQGDLNKQLTFTMGVTSQQILASDALVLTSSSDITLDAAGNNIYFKNGGGADTWTWTLNDDATGSFSSPDYFTLEGFGGLELKSNYLFGGDNNLYLTSYSSIKADATAFYVTGDSDLQYLKFTGGDGLDDAQEINASDGLNIYSNKDIKIKNGRDINSKNSGSGGSIILEAISSNPPIGVDGIISLDAETAIYLQADTGTIIMSAGSAALSGASLRYNLEQSRQEIVATDGIYMISGNSGDIWLNSAGNILLDASTGKIDLYHNGAQDVRFDVATTDTLKLYTGTSTLNSTFAGDDLTVQGDVNSVSDVRTKENIETVENGLDLVSQLRGVWYNKIAEEDRKVGVIAQEVEEVLPEVVHTDTEGMKSVDYGKMVGVLIEAIKELKQEIDELKGN